MNVKLVSVSSQPLDYLERLARARVQAGDGVWFGAPLAHRRHSRHVKRLVARFAEDDGLMWSYTERGPAGEMALLIVAPLGAKMVGTFSKFDFDPAS